MKSLMDSKHDQSVNRARLTQSDVSTYRSHAPVAAQALVAIVRDD